MRKDKKAFGGVRYDIANRGAKMCQRRADATRCERGQMPPHSKLLNS